MNTAIVRAAAERIVVSRDRSVGTGQEWCEHRPAKVMGEVTLEANGVHKEEVLKCRKGFLTMSRGDPHKPKSS